MLFGAEVVCAQCDRLILDATNNMAFWWNTIARGLRYWILRRSIRRIHLYYFVHLISFPVNFHVLPEPIQLDEKMRARIYNIVCHFERGEKLIMRKALAIRWSNEIHTHTHFFVILLIYLVVICWPAWRTCFAPVVENCKERNMRRMLRVRLTRSNHYNRIGMFYANCLYKYSTIRYLKCECGRTVCVKRENRRSLS